MNTASEGGWRRRIGEEVSALLLVVLIAGFYLLVVRGYRIYAGDQRHYFLKPFRDLTPDFITRDWLTWETKFTSSLTP